MNSKITKMEGNVNNLLCYINSSKRWLIKFFNKNIYQLYKNERNKVLRFLVEPGGITRWNSAQSSFSESFTIEDKYCDS